MRTGTPSRSSAGGRCGDVWVRREAVGGQDKQCTMDCARLDMHGILTAAWRVPVSVALRSKGTCAAVLTPASLQLSSAIDIARIGKRYVSRTNGYKLERRMKRSETIASI